MPPARVDADHSPDFVLRRRGGAFRRRSMGRSRLYSPVCCCCCCCLDILGAWTGAYLGGLLGSGIGYRKLRRERPTPSFGWPALWSVVGTFVMFGIPAGLFIALDLAVEDATVWVLAGVLSGWSFVATPVWCFVVARRFSGRLLAISLLISFAGALLGLATGAAIMGGSALFAVVFH
jgi:hypothetical protein